ncbi:MAG TPA: corrinoid protein [Victivallales bacterium]|nr:corrinoid protein [Victivallales bacterium]HRR27821.1 corrinoid protein [Victivallales bacterium]HRU00118.1 corrinoid protein [Victivallales bacterium]
MSAELLNQIKEALMKGKANDVKALTEKAISENIPVGDILEKALISGMSVIGEKFKNNQVYVPEVLIAARAMNTAMAVLKPLLKASDVKARGIICIGTVKGDLHDIGKNLVRMMLEGAGYEVIDLGVNVDAQKFVQCVKEKNTQIVAMSALLTTTMGAMKSTIEELKAAGLKVKTIVGGAPLTASFAKEIGADGYAPDAASAVDVVNKLIAA